MVAHQRTGQLDGQSSMEKEKNMPKSACVRHPHTQQTFDDYITWSNFQECQLYLSMEASWAYLTFLVFY